jgi:hypothetical protein
MKTGLKTIVFFVALAVVAVGCGCISGCNRLPTRDQFVDFHLKAGDIGVGALSVEPKVTSFLSALGRDPSSATSSDFQDRLRTLRDECDALRKRAEDLEPPPGCQTLKALTVAEATDQCKAVDSLMSYTGHLEGDSLNQVVDDEKLVLKDGEAFQAEYWRLDRLISG